jgi:DNA polymerase-3 subunit alpha
MLIKKPEVPDFDIPKDFTTSDEYLHHLVILGLENHYSDKVNTVKAQAEHELGIIKQLGFTDYFLIVADIINWARKHDIPISPGRGQAPSSLVIYALGITSIDPIKYGLVFERFANLEYPTIPDIDVDFSIDGREKVINYVIEKYGIDHVGRIAINGNGEDNTKHSGLHAAGLIISRENLNSYVPVNNDSETGLSVVKCDMDELTIHGLIRFDFLGLETLDDIKRNDDIPLNDKATFNMLSEGNTDGVFEFESEPLREILKQCKPDCFEHLIALYALYHPGQMEYIPEFIERRHGHKPIEYPHPCLEDILKETYGLIIYQEQFMRIIQRIAGYTFGKTDLLRRHLLKASKTSQNPDDKKHFITSAIAQGFNEQEAEHIFKSLASVAGFVYSKSNAVGISLLAYQTAYLKANF